MKIYLYDKNTGENIDSIDAMAYTDEYVVENRGARLCYGQQMEFSLAEGEKQGLRQAYKQRNPSDSDRLAQLEDLVAGMLYGGESI